MKGASAIAGRVRVNNKKKEIFLVKSIICKVMIIVTKRGGDNYSNMIIRSM